MPWVGGRRPTRVAHHERFGGAGDDDVTIVAFDDQVELQLVPGKHEEPCRIGPNGFVLAGAEVDELVAVRPQALTEEHAVTASTDAFVDPPVLVSVVEEVGLWQLLHTTAIPARSNAQRRVIRSRNSYRDGLGTSAPSGRVGWDAARSMPRGRRG